MPGVAPPEMATSLRSPDSDRANRRPRPSRGHRGAAGGRLARLTETYPDVDWQVPAVTDPLVTPPAQTTELIDAAHERLLREDWELALCLTDLPFGSERVRWQGTPTVLALILAHDQWERREPQKAREQIVLSNVVTAVTLILGVLALSRLSSPSTLRPAAR